MNVHLSSCFAFLGFICLFLFFNLVFYFAVFVCLFCFKQF